MNILQTTYSHQPRYTELDALRGLAALSVVLWHFFCATYTISLPGIKQFIWSLYILVPGRSAVILFFILSGFVLSLPFLRDRQPGNGGFLIRRICRIYLPYLVLVAGAILVRTFMTTRSLSGLSDWFNNYCGDPFSFKTALEHFFLVGNIHSDVYNNVIWSLIHEMRLSLVFPLLFLFVTRIGPGASIVSCIPLSGISLMNEVFGWETSNGWQSGYFYSLHIAALFIIGILLARYKDRIVRWYVSLKKTTKMSMLIVALLFYRMSQEIAMGNENLLLISDYGVVLGVCGLMVTTLGSRRVSTLLRKPFLVFLGDISYSIYLNHITVLYLVFFLLYEHLPVPVIFPVYVVAVLIVSFVTWKIIELPAIALGRTLSHRLNAHNARI